MFAGTSRARTEPAIATSAARVECVALAKLLVPAVARPRAYDGFQVPERSGCIRVFHLRCERSSSRGSRRSIWTVDRPE